MKQLIIIGICSLFTSCLPAKTNYFLNQNAYIDTLSVCVNYSELIDLEVQKSFERAISDDIIRFNHENHKFKLAKCNDSTFRSLNIDVKEMKFVTNQNRVVTTLLSLAVTTVSFYFYYTNSLFIGTFWFSPETRSDTYFRLSNDLTFKEQSNYIKPSNRAFFLNRKKQIDKHTLTFVRFVRNELCSVEKQYNIKPKSFMF